MVRLKGSAALDSSVCDHFVDKHCSTNLINATQQAIDLSDSALTLLRDGGIKPMEGGFHGAKTLDRKSFALSHHQRVPRNLLKIL